MQTPNGILPVDKPAGWTSFDVLAKLRGVDTPEAAILLRGQTVSIDRSGVKRPEGTVFIADLIGCRVLDREEF